MKKKQSNFAIKIKEKDGSWGEWTGKFNSFEECKNHFNNYFKDDPYYHDDEFIILESYKNTEIYHIHYIE